MCLPHPSLPLENCCAFTVQRADGRRCVIVFAAMNMSLWGADLKTWVTTDFEQSTNEILKILLILTLIFLSVPMLHAQQFEQGSGIGGCQAGSGVCNGWQWQGQQQGEQQQQSPVPPVRWADRLGSIAIGDQPNHTGTVGVSANMASKTAAESAAIADCRAAGGEKCEITRTYSDGCAALAWGTQGTKSTGLSSTGFSSGGTDIDQAKDKAIKFCSQRASSCKVVYSACSMAVRIQ